MQEESSSASPGTEEDGRSALTGAGAEGTYEGGCTPLRGFSSSTGVEDAEVIGNPPHGTVIGEG